MTITILLIDDDPQVETVINLVLGTSYNNMFQMLGVARSLEEAKRKVVFEKPDIIFLGDKLRDCSLERLLTQNFLNTQTNKFVIAQGKRYAYFCFKAGVKDYLLKPMGVSTIDKILKPYRSLFRYEEETDSWVFESGGDVDFS